MIFNTKDIITHLESKLNEQIFNTCIGTYDAPDALIPKTKCRFKIFDEEGDLECPATDPERLNYIIEPINCVLRFSPGGDNEGFDESAYVGTKTATLEILIPHADLITNGEAKYINTVKEAVLSVFQLNDVFNLTTKDGETFLVTVAYGGHSLGERAVRPMVGDSIPMTIGMSFAFVSAGIPPTFVSVKILGDSGYEDVPLHSFSFARTSEVEGNVSSEDGGNAKATISSSTFGVTMTAPLRNNAISRMLANYIFNADISPLKMRIYIEGITAPVTKEVSFLQGEISGQVPSALSSTMSLVEVL